MPCSSRDSAEGTTFALPNLVPAALVGIGEKTHTIRQSTA